MGAVPAVAAGVVVVELVVAGLLKIPDPKMLEPVGFALFPDPEFDAGVGRLKRLMLIEGGGSADANIDPSGFQVAAAIFPLSNPSGIL